MGAFVLAAADITSDTSMPLGLVWAILIATVTGSGFLYGIFYRLGTLTKEVRSLARDGWTVQDHTLWSERMKVKNPALHMPTVRKSSQRNLEETEIE